MSSSVLFDRRCSVQVGTLLIEAGEGTGLDVEFTVKRGVKITAGAAKPQPNTCDLIIYGLSLSHQKELEQSTVPGAGRQIVPVTISAGYKDRSSVIFSGELRAADTVTDGPETTTTLTTGDGDDALSQKRLSLALAKGSTARQGLEAIVAALGIGEGNLQKGIQLLEAQPLASKLFARGVVLKGAAADIMTDFCRSVGLDWSIQNGKLQLTALGQPIAGDAILLDSDHGLYGGPTVDTKGILTAKTAMLPDVVPGRALSMNAQHVQGGFRILHVETKGDTAGDDWGHTIEAKRY